MNDDQSMRDLVAGRHDPGDRAAESRQPGSSPARFLDGDREAEPAAPPGEWEAGPAARHGDWEGEPPAGPDPAHQEHPRRDQIRLDQIRPDQARLDQARLDQARLDQARLDQARLDQARLDHARRYQALQDGSGPEQPPDDQAADSGSEDSQTKTHRPIWRELLVLVVAAIVIALVIKTFVVQAFFIPSSSMEDTLLIGDKVLVNKLVYHFRPIRAGDIVVFNGAGSWVSAPRPAPASSDPIVRLYDVTLLPLARSIGGLFGTAPGQTDYIKRVIGVPGDHVACCNAQGQITVNGIALHERSYLFPGAAPSQIRFSTVVPPGRLWVMGDNRQISDDSRLHTNDPGGGTIPQNKVIGRAFMIVWPPGRWRVLQIPATFGQAGVIRAAAAGAGAVGVLAARAGTAAPYLPLAGGLAAALPLTWRRLRARPRRSHAQRHR